MPEWCFLGSLPKYTTCTHVLVLGSPSGGSQLIPRYGINRWMRLQLSRHNQTDHDREQVSRQAQIAWEDQGKSWGSSLAKKLQSASSTKETHKEAPILDGLTFRRSPICPTSLFTPSPITGTRKGFNTWNWIGNGSGLEAALTNRFTSPSNHSLSWLPFPFYSSLFIHIFMHS